MKIIYMILTYISQLSHTSSLESDLLISLHFDMQLSRTEYFNETVLVLSTYSLQILKPNTNLAVFFRDTTPTILYWVRITFYFGFHGIHRFYGTRDLFSNLECHRLSFVGVRYVTWFHSIVTVK